MARLELDAIQGKVSEDKSRLEAMGAELHALGQQVHTRGNEASAKLAEAEKLKADAISAQRMALAAKNQVDVERSRLAEEVKRAEAERVQIAHERMTLIRDQTNSRQLGMKLASAVTVSKTPGGQAAWSALPMPKPPSQPQAASTSQAGIYNREVLGMLRKQVAELGAGGGVGRSEFLEKEESFMRAVRKGGQT